MNKVHRMMSRVVPYALAVLIAGLVVRSVSVVIAASIPYNTWPLGLRISIEIVAVLGLVVCAEIVSSAAAARRAVILNQIRQLEESDEYKPSPRLKGEAREQRIRELDAARARAVRRMEAEAKGEMTMVYGGGALTTFYGASFAALTVHTLSATVIAMEMAMFVALPFIVYYFSARYKPETHDPGETATNATTAALDKRVRHSGKRILANTYDGRDVAVLEAAAPDTAIHRKMLAALRPIDTSGMPEMSTSDVYAALGIGGDKSAKASIRRVIKRAGEAKRLIPGTEELMVRWDDREGEWRTRQASMSFLWPGGYKPSTPRTGGEQGASTPRTGGEQGASIPRTSRKPQTISDVLVAFERQAAEQRAN